MAKSVINFFVNLFVSKQVRFRVFIDRFAARALNAITHNWQFFTELRVENQLIYFLCASSLLGSPPGQTWYRRSNQFCWPSTKIHSKRAPINAHGHNNITTASTPNSDDCVYFIVPFGIMGERVRFWCIKTPVHVVTGPKLAGHWWVSNNRWRI